MFKNLFKRKITPLEKNEIVIEWLKEKKELFEETNVPTTDPSRFLEILLDFEMIKRKYMLPKNMTDLNRLLESP